MIRSLSNYIEVIDMGTDIVVPVGTHLHAHQHIYIVTSRNESQWTGDIGKEYTKTLDTYAYAVEGTLILVMLPSPLPNSRPQWAYIFYLVSAYI